MGAPVSRNESLLLLAVGGLALGGFMFAGWAFLDPWLRERRRQRHRARRGDVPTPLRRAR
jgi:hypothetical protein